VKDLLPYLAGAASAFVVQFLVQVYVVPLVDRRRRRLERWEKDVLDLGELLSGTVSDTASQARSDQFAVRMITGMAGSPEYDPAFVKRELSKYLIAARQATSDLRGRVNSRAAWIMDRVTMYRPGDLVVKFTQASLRYRVHLAELAPDDWRDLSEKDWDRWWDEEQRLRRDLISAVQKLAWDRRPLRISWRSRFGHARRRIKRCLTRPNRTPIEPKPATHAEPGEASAPEEGVLLRSPARPLAVGRSGQPEVSSELLRRVIVTGFSFCASSWFHRDRSEAGEEQPLGCP
jgi:hypothetical protein